MNLESLFSPKSIAVIGASTKPGSVGHGLTENLLKNRYTGKIYPVNPKTDTLFDLPCYPNIAAIPDDVELAIIIIPAAAVPTALREAGMKGTKAAIIISSGFKETGSAGKALEEETKAIATEYDIALLGPNCLGFLHPALSLNASFAKTLPKDGSIAFFSQSGALCTALLDLTGETLGYSSFVSDGNKAVIGERELLRYFAEDKQTKVISFYSEGLTDATGIIETGRTILSEKSPKPVIALKSGATDAGTKASNSHTGALAGSDQAYDALFKQARIIRATSLEHLTDLLAVFSQNPLPAGKRVAIVTNAGGLGVLATDAAIRASLCLAKLTETTTAKLRAALPPAASSHNPVDVLGDALADRYRMAIEAVATDSQVDALIVIVTPQTMTEAKKTAETIVDVKTSSGKPIVAVFAGKTSLEEGISLLEKNGVATLTYPEAAAEALGSLARVASWHARATLRTSFSIGTPDRKRVKDIFSKAKKENREMLSEKEAWETLRAYGFPFLESRMVESREEALEAAQAFKKAMVLKIVSPDITHKSDVGGVILDVTANDAEERYDELMRNVRTHAPDARIQGALAVEMAPMGGHEIILGMKKEPGLGSLLLIGLGGIYVETFKDVAFRFAPITQEDADEMLKELKTYPLLQGARGKQGVDLEALKNFLGRLSALVTDFPEIEELDINPLLAFPDADDFHVLDARIRIRI